MDSCGVMGRLQVITATIIIYCYILRAIHNLHLHVDKLHMSLPQMNYFKKTVHSRAYNRKLLGIEYKYIKLNFTQIVVNYFHK